MPTFYFIADWFRLLILILRIDYTFRDSYLSYSPKTIGCLYFSTFFMILLIFMMILPLLIIRNQMLWIILLFGTIYALIDVLLSIILTIMFLKKLFYLIVQHITIKNNELTSRPSPYITGIYIHYVFQLYIK